VQHVREELLENIASKIELRKEEEARVYWLVAHHTPGSLFSIIHSLVGLCWTEGSEGRSRLLL